MTTTVVNLKHKPTPRYDVYVGRVGKDHDGFFGNRHTLGHVRPCPACRIRSGVNTRHSPEECREIFEVETANQIIDDREFRRRILGLRDLVLACFCVRRDGSGWCHAKFYVQLLDTLPADATEADLSWAAKCFLFSKSRRGVV